MGKPLLATIGKAASDTMIKGGKGSGVLKAANGLTDAVSTGVVSLTPPMPSPDLKNAKTLSQQFRIFKDWLSRSRQKPRLDAPVSSYGPQKAAAIRMQRRITHPFKSTARVFDRTVPGAISSMPMLNFGLSPQMTAYAGVNPLSDVLNQYTTTQLGQMAKTHGKGMLDAAKYGAKEVFSGRVFQPKTPQLYSFMRTPQSYLQ